MMLKIIATYFIMKTLLLLSLIAISFIEFSSAQSNDIEEDMRLTTTQLLRKYGYPAEEHRVVTSDGYILEMHRCPGSPLSPPASGKPVAFVMHGMLSSSADFVIMGPQTALAYMLADHGYDVWMPNARGNRYSVGHTSLNTESKEFWSFSWHEVGTTDIPANLDYIRDVTGQERVHYIGHSQGTTVFWVFGSERPEYQNRIISMQALAPAAYMHNTKSPYVIWLAAYLYTTELSLEMMGTYYFSPTQEMDLKGGYEQCRDGAPSQAMCANTIFLMAGYNTQELNMTMLPILNAHSPAGASTRQMLHFGQIARSALFRQYDHGVVLNTIYYGTIYPPLYSLSKVTAPVVLWHGFNDWMATPTDVALLNLGLPNVVRKQQISQLAFNHMDFVWAMNVRNLLYNDLIAQMKSME